MPHQKTERIEWYVRSRHNNASLLSFPADSELHARSRAVTRDVTYPEYAPHCVIKCTIIEEDVTNASE